MNVYVIQRVEYKKDYGADFTSVEDVVAAEDAAKAGCERLKQEHADSRRNPHFQYEEFELEGRTLSEDFCWTCCRMSTTPVAPDVYTLTIGVKPDALLTRHLGPGSCEYLQCPADKLEVGDHILLSTYRTTDMAQAGAGTEVSFVIEEVKMGPGPTEFAHLLFDIRPSHPATHWPEFRPSAQSEKLKQALKEDT